VSTSDEEGRPTGYESYEYLSDGRYAITTYDVAHETIEDIVTYDMNGQALTYESFKDFDANGIRDYYEKGFYAPGDINPFTGETMWEECSEIEIRYGDDGTVEAQWNYFYNSLHQKTGGVKTDAQGKIIEKMTYSYHDNGELKEYCAYDAYGTMFEQDTYDEQGERLFSLYMSDWDGDGVYERVYEDSYEGGLLITEITKDDKGNVIDRTEYEYHENGERKKVTEYDSFGRMEKWKTYDENGDPLAYAEYWDWMDDGVFDFYEEGTYRLDQDGFYRQCPSLYLEFDKQGEVAKRGIYTYYDNGELKEYCETDANGVIVDWESYDEQGVPQKYLYREDRNYDGYYDYYEEGIYVWDERTERYEEAATLEQEMSSDGTAFAKTEYEYHENGKKKSKKIYDHRGDIKEWYTYDENGAPLMGGGYYDLYEDDRYDVYSECFFAWSEEWEEYVDYPLLLIYYDRFGGVESREVYIYYEGTTILCEYTEYNKDDVVTEWINYNEQGEPLTYIERTDWDDDGFCEEYEEGIAVWDAEYEYFYKRMLVSIEYRKDGSMISRSEYEYHENGEFKKISRYDGNGKLIIWETYDENGAYLAYAAWGDMDGDGNVDVYEESIYGWHDEYGYNNFVMLREEYDNEGNLQNRTEFEYYPSGYIKKEIKCDAQGHVLLLFEYDPDGYVVRICEAFQLEEGGNIDYTDTYCIWNEEYEFYDYYPVLSIEYTSEWQIIERKEFTYDEAGELILIVVKDKDGNVIERIELEN
jgi:antitoxin component YwqK of YwqJK toxin-antitoxin module